MKAGRPRKLRVKKSIRRRRYRPRINSAIRQRARVRRRKGR